VGDAPPGAPGGPAVIPVGAAPPVPPERVTSPKALCPTISKLLDSEAFLVRALLILPTDSAEYWLHAAFQTDRIGPLAHVGNYSVGGIVATVSAPGPMPVAWWLAATVYIARAAFPRPTGPNASDVDCRPSRSRACSGARSRRWPGVTTGCGPCPSW
jgi:hypothetical protein